MDSNVTPYTFQHKIPAAHTGCALKRIVFIYFLIEFKNYLRKQQ